MAAAANGEQERSQEEHDEHAESILNEVDGLGDLSEFEGKKEVKKTPERKRRLRDEKVKFSPEFLAKFFLGTRKPSRNIKHLKEDNSPLVKVVGRGGTWINFYQQKDGKFAVRTGVISGYGEGSETALISFQQPVCVFDEEDLKSITFSVTYESNRKYKAITIKTTFFTLKIRDNGDMDITHTD